MGMKVWMTVPVPVDGETVTLLGEFRFTPGADRFQAGWRCGVDVEVDAIGVLLPVWHCGVLTGVEPDAT